MNNETKENQLIDELNDYSFNVLGQYAQKSQDFGIESVKKTNDELREIADRNGMDFEFLIHALSIAFNEHTKLMFLSKKAAEQMKSKIVSPTGGTIQ